MSLLAELKRRNVFRAATVYVAVAWLLIQVAETTFPAFGLDDGRLRVLIIILVIGFVPAVALAWLFELTPEGIKRDRDLPPGSPLLAQTNRLLDRAIVALLALGLTYFAVDKFFLSPAREQARVEEALEQGRSEALAERLGDKSIVVLPFANLSPDPDQAYLADGLAEELLNLLARIPELRVISRTSAFAFKGKDVGLAEIAQQLKVSHALEGSVRRSGDRIRVTAQLIETGTDAHVWSETYERTLDDVFAIQDEIASHVAEALRLELLGTQPRSRRVDPQAYLLFMQARQMLDAWGEPEQIHGMLQRALQIDANYADAWTGLSWLYFRCGLEQVREASAFCLGYSVEQAQQLSQQALQNALTIDPNNAIAIAYGAYRKAFGEHDWAGGAADFERALRLDPTRPDVLRGTLAFLRFIRRPDLAIRLGEFAVASDPLCSACAYYLARAYAEAGRLDEAEARMRDFAATGRGGWHTIATILLLKGEPSAALDAVASIPDAETNPSVMHVRAMALHSLGRDEESLAALSQLESASGQEHSQMLAEVHAWRGETERAFKLLEALSARPPSGAAMPSSTFGAFSPFLRPLLDTPRGQALLRPLGLADDQLAAIRFELQLPDQNR